MVIAIAILVWIVLVVRAFRRPNRRWLPARLLLTTLAMAALALAGLQPTRPAPSGQDIALLLSGRIDRDKLDSLRNTLHPEFLFTLDSSLAGKIPALSLLPDLEYLLRHFPAVRRLHLLGDGLEPEELNLLRDHELHFHLNDSPPAGIVELNYSSAVTEGSLVILKGVFNQPEQGHGSLRLSGPAGEITLLKDLPPGLHPFKASFPAQAAGRYLLSLVISGNGGKEQQKDQLPLVITPGIRPRVLILNQAPSFETRFLKNWLAAQGYPVAVRSAVSRGKFLSEFDNDQPVNLNAIREPTLNGFDVLITEANTLAALEPLEVNAIEKAVRQGMGICLLLGETLPAWSGSRQSFFMALPRRPGGPACRIAGIEREVAKAPFVLLKAPLVFPLLSDEKGQWLASFRLRDQGRIAHSVLADTYQLLLESKDQVYARLWTALLRGVTRRQEKQQEWQLPEPPLVFPHQPLELTLITADAQPDIQVSGPDSSRLRIPPSGHPFLEDQWSGSFWPRESGWHRLTTLNTPQEEAAWIFVQDTGAWESLRISKKRRANLLRAARQEIKNPPLPAGSVIRIPYPLWWFYLLFLFATASLWLEERW